MDTSFLKCLPLSAALISLISIHHVLDLGSFLDPPTTNTKTACLRRVEKVFFPLPGEVGQLWRWEQISAALA